MPMARNASALRREASASAWRCPDNSVTILCGPRVISSVRMVRQTITSAPPSAVTPIQK